jgi:hypothetical protein
VSSREGICSYVIDTVEPWHIGKYDCIKIYKDTTCYSKYLVIQKAVEVPTEITTITTVKSQPRPETTKITTVESQPKTENTAKTTMKTLTFLETTSEYYKDVTKDSGSYSKLIYFYIWFILFPISIRSKTHETTCFYNLKREKKTH